MIPVYYMAALANHLWQSTLFTGAVAVLMLALRRKQAHTRHQLWLAASVKFLVPFSLLSQLGSRLAVFRAAGSPHPASQPALSAVVEQIGRPFLQTMAIPQLPHPAFAGSSPGLMPSILILVWVLGCLAVAFSYCRRWLKVRSAVRLASPLHLEYSLKLPVPVRSSPAMLEPGVFGMFSPVLLLPDGIADRLTPFHLEAILAHELCHVRRRDNLTAAIQMLVEAVFWFHPLVWWLGARLVEERENACDEEVLRLGSRREVYAESILKTCQFYLESPVACMSGIADSDLKKRITRIMTQQFSTKLSIAGRLFLAAAGVAALAGPVVFGLLNAPRGFAQSPPPSTGPRAAFEVVSIKPNHAASQGVMIRMSPGLRFEAQNITARFLLQEAYSVKDSQISGAPGWIDSERFDIEAKPDDAVANEKNKLDRDEVHLRMSAMLQSMLEDRFKLSLHHETKEMSLYVLVVGKGGAKFHETTAPAIDPESDPGPPKPGAPMARGSIRMMGRGDLTLSGVPMTQFAEVLARQSGHMVLDKTGLKGEYDFTLKWTPEDGANGVMGDRPGHDGNASPVDPNGPSLFVALQEQLGLKLESQKGPVDTIVIDRIEKPSEN